MRNPFARNTRIQSACERWNSAPLYPSHCTAHGANCARASSLRIGSSSSSGVQRCASVDMVRKRRRPPGRRSRAASATHFSGSAHSDAPYSENATSKLESGSGTDSAGASTSGNSMPVSCCRRRAVWSCAGVGSTPTGRAPARASFAEKYAVPHPSSTRSRPATSPSHSSAMPKTPHSRAGSFQASDALASVYSRFVFVHCATFAATRSASELIGGEPERDLALGRLRRVGAVDEVVRHRAREVAANRARLRIGGGRRADRLAHRRDCAFAFHDERPGRARRDELDELAEERLLAVLAVVLLAELAAHGEQLARAHGEAAVLDPLQDLAGEAPLDGIQLDQDECAFDGHCGGHSNDVRIDHVQVAAPPGCEEEARAFYGGVLGLEELDKPEP